MMSPTNIAGVLIVPSTEGSINQLKDLRARGLPVVMFDRTLPGLEAGEVVVENCKGARKAVEHLLEHGHQRILCVGYNKQYNSIGERIAGYEKAMASAGYKTQLLIVNDAATIAPRLLKRLHLVSRPTAIFTLNNDHHRGAVFAAARRHSRATGDSSDRF